MYWFAIVLLAQYSPRIGFYEAQDGRMKTVIKAFDDELCPQVDVAVIEVGIGGAYDCTNIIKWDACQHATHPHYPQTMSDWRIL